MTKRVVGILCIIFAMFMLLYLRIYFIGADDSIAQVAKNQGTYILDVDEIRGRIYDRNFDLLVNDNEHFVYAIAPNADSMEIILEKSEEDTAKIYDLFSANKPFLFDGIPDGISLETDSITPILIKERYSKNQLATHIIGHLDGDGKGVNGIEKSYNKNLSDLSGKISVSYDVDALSNVLSGIEPEVINNSYDNLQGIVLTLDKKIQNLVEKVGGKSIEKGAILVMDCESGQIIASASFPEFDPNNVVDSLDGEDAPLINRNFSAYNVGSVFKLTVMAAALENGVSTDYTYECTGSIEVGDTVFHCLNRAGHGEIDMDKALQVSCNPYFVNLAMEKVGAARIREMAVNMGFGAPDELAPDMIASAGAIPTLEELENLAEFANFSFGQGKLAATPIQIAKSISALANGGYVVDPTVILGLSDQSGSTILKAEGNNQSVKILDDDVANVVKRLMENVVLEGSGRNANPEYGGAGGKTGSAQTGIFDESDEEIVHAWFAGFFPAENPRYTIVILNEGANSGSEFAAPLFKEIANGINSLESYNHPWFRQIELEMKRIEEEKNSGSEESDEEVTE